MFPRRRQAGKKWSRPTTSTDRPRLIFLKPISNAFDAKLAALLAEDPAAAEDPDEYLAENGFWVPEGIALVAPAKPAPPPLPTPPPPRGPGSRRCKLSRCNGRHREAQPASGRSGQGFTVRLSDKVMLGN